MISSLEGRILQSMTPSSNFTPYFPSTVSIMRYHSAIQLYYMAQLMLPEGNFLAGPDLILWTFKSKKVSQAGDRKKKWEGFEIWERFSTFCCLWRWPCKKECRWVLRAGSHPSLQMAREWRLQLTTAKNWLLPTAWMNLETDFTQILQVRTHPSKHLYYCFVIS